MRRYLTIGLAGLAILAGCGGSEDEPTTAAASGGEPTVTVKSVDGVGRILVDAGGAALYTADQETDGTIRCVDDCLAFCQPLTAPESGPVQGGTDVRGTLDVVERDDGTQQVTHDGRPVYRFSEDEDGRVTGDGLEDDFGGMTFSWQVITVGGDGGDAPAGGYD